IASAGEVDVVGGHSSGEVEFVLVGAADALYIGVGSDHTDRKVETYGVTVSKQMCPKPVGPELWPFAELESHWDRLVLRSHVTRGGKRRLYQEGEVTQMLAPRDLLARLSGSTGLAPGTAMFCGTLPVRGEIGGGERFEIELHDPVKGRSLRHEYAVRELAIADGEEESVRWRSARSTPSSARSTWTAAGRNCPAIRQVSSSKCSPATSTRRAGAGSARATYASSPACIRPSPS